MPYGRRYEREPDREHNRREAGPAHERRAGVAPAPQPEVRAEQIEIGHEEEDDRGARKGHVGVAHGGARQPRDHEHRREDALHKQRDVRGLPCGWTRANAAGSTRSTPAANGSRAEPASHAPTPPRLLTTRSIATTAARGSSARAPRPCTNAAVACGMPFVMLTCWAGSATSVAADPSR